MSEEKKKIEIVDGDGSNLDISNVYDHLNPGKPRPSEDKPRNVIIPEEHKNVDKKSVQSNILKFNDKFF